MKLTLKHVLAAITLLAGALAGNAFGQAPAGRFVVTIETSVSEGARPIITGKTNLPDGTKLDLWLLKPWLPNARERAALNTFMCDPTLFASRDCTPLTASGKLPGDSVVVESGRFTYGPITDRGAPLSPGAYVLEVMANFVVEQPPNVRAIIGQHGENMLGPMVNGCCFRSIDQAETQKQLQATKRDEPILGASIYYARYVEIGSPPYQPPPQPGQFLTQQAPTTPPASSGIANTFNRPSAQQTDPYADSYQQQATAHFRQELDGLSNTIHNLNFALGCKVLTQQVQISRLIAGPVRALIEKAIQNGVDAVQIHNQLQEAARGGLALASEVGACDYWKQHPDEVYALRRAVETAYRSFPY
jgi:hypothetical protein